MKHILFVTTIYRIGERIFPIIPKLAETYKLSLLTLYQMHPEGKYQTWNGTYDMRNRFHSEYDKYFDQYLYKEVGYEKLVSLTMGLFASPYAATSLREYFANGFEAYFIGDRKGLQNISPVLYNKFSTMEMNK